MSDLLSTAEAAEMLAVAPGTLRVWQMRHGFPVPQRDTMTVGYSRPDILALAAALQSGTSISVAVEQVRNRRESDAGILARALEAADVRAADEVMNALRDVATLGSALQTVLLPALDDLHEVHGPQSAMCVLAASWAEGWLLRVARLHVALGRGGRVLLVDATSGATSRDALRMRCLQLLCQASGLRVLQVPLWATGIERVLDEVPAATVIVGSDATAEALGLWRQRAADVELGRLVVFRRPLEPVTSGALELPAEPGGAVSALLAHLAVERQTAR